MPPVDQKSYRRRLAIAGAFLLLLLLLVFGWHARDALKHGDSLWPVGIGIVISLAVIGATFSYVTREGRTNVRVRSARLMKWALPVAAAVAVIRVLAGLAGWA